MPELKIGKRRSPPRRDIPVLPGMDAVSAPVDETLSRRRRLALSVLAGLFLCGLAAMFGLPVSRESFVVTGENERPVRAPSRRQHGGRSSRTRSNGPSGRRPNGRASVHRGRRPTLLEAARRPSTRAALAEIARLLQSPDHPRCTPDDFGHRLSLFRRLSSSLPASYRESLFPMITPGDLENLFKEDPRRACLLLDKLFDRCRILLD